MAHHVQSFGRPLRLGAQLRKMADDSTVAGLARAWGEECIDVLADVALNAENTASTRVTAAVALLDRGFGRPQTRSPDPAPPVVITDISMDQLMAARARIVDEC